MSFLKLQLLFSFTVCIFPMFFFSPSILFILFSPRLPLSFLSPHFSTFFSFLFFSTSIFPSHILKQLLISADLRAPLLMKIVNVIQNLMGRSKFKWTESDLLAKYCRYFIDEFQDEIRPTLTLCKFPG